jgi:hypothetical protein
MAGDEMNEEPIIKLVLTCFLTVICGVWAWVTKGESGIGWFILGMVIIWCQE